MNIVEVVQGTSNWLALRARHFTASEAPAMLGLSKYQSRADLLKQKHTGLAAEVDGNTQRLFDRGHAAEESARPVIEAAIGEDLFPATCTEMVEGLPLLASLDGMTMDEKTLWEHKLYGEDLAKSVLAEDLAAHYWAQLEHQLLVTGAERVIFTVSDGTMDNMVSCEYRSIPERRAKIIAGWKQFAEDLANYQHAESKPESIGHAPDQLPALRIEVTGMVTASNLAEFKETALAVFRGINTNLQTDQDFADAEKAVKFCKDAEDRLEAAKSHALSQTASIDELFRTIDGIRDEARTVRLKLDKLVKAEKENRRGELVREARFQLIDHIGKLCDRIGGLWMPSADSFPPPADAIKGLKTLDSMRDKLGVWLANAKIQSNEIADRIEANRKTVGSAVELAALMPDFPAICQKPAEDFAAILAVRKQHQAEAEAKRIADEATAKAKADAMVEAVPVAEQAMAPVAVVDTKKAVIEHQDEIAAFMASREWKKGEETRIRAVLVEFIKWKAAYQKERIAA